jgi:hypothetical protein
MNNLDINDLFIRLIKLPQYRPKTLLSLIKLIRDDISC